MEKDISYNRYLYEKRLELKLSKRKFAKKLHMSRFKYSLIEKGYFLPTRKTAQRISNILNDDFTIYIEGKHSYPEDIYETKRFVDHFKDFLAQLWVRVTLSIVMFFSLCFSVTGSLAYNHCCSNPRHYYSERYTSFVDEVREKGSITFSALHELIRYTISDNDTENNVSTSIIVSHEDLCLRDMTVYVNYKTDEGDILYSLPNRVSKYKDYMKFNFTLYNVGSTVSGEIKMTDGAYKISSLNFDGSEADISQEEVNSLSDVVSLLAVNVYQRLDNLIFSKLGLDYTYSELLNDFATGARNHQTHENFYMIVGILGIVLFFSSLFVLIFSYILNSKIEDAKPAIIHRTFQPLKRDIHFFPFIPETVFEIAGIVLTFFGSMRIFFYLITFMSSGSLLTDLWNTAPKSFFIFFTIGMFLLYFLDFDIFLEDKYRSFRNVFLYGFTFLGLYIVESFGIDYFTSRRAVTSFLLSRFTIPNNFSSIACYFLMLVFLYQRPKFVDTKGKLIAFRSLVLLPIAWLVVSTVISQNYKYFGWNLNTWQLNIFSSERPQFTILCVAYLLGFYFLRLYFIRKYGEENAQLFFHSNRFYLYKNSLICAIVSLSALSEYLFQNFATVSSRTMGYWQIIYLVPFLFFYHPHFGKRNNFVDYLTLGLYFLAMSLGYLSVVAVALVFYGNQ